MKTKVLDLGTYGYSSKQFNKPNHDVNALLGHVHVPMVLSLVHCHSYVWCLAMGDDVLVVQML